MKAASRLFWDADLKRNITVFLFISIVMAGNVWLSAYETDDDALFSLANYGFFAKSAVAQSRISFYLLYPFIKLPYIINDIRYISIAKLSSILLLISLMAYYLTILFENKSIFSIALVILALLWSNSAYSHNMLAAYPFYFLFMGHLFCIYLIAIEKIPASRHAINWLPCIPLIFFFLLSVEIFIQYIPLLFVINYINIKRKGLNEGWRPWWPLIVSVFIGVTVNVLYKSFNKSGYNGNTSVNIDLLAIADTYYKLTTGLFPGFQFFYNKNVLLLDFRDVVFATLISFVATVFLISSREGLRSKDIDISIRGILLYLLCCVLAILAPNIFISLTSKYQRWAAAGVNNYLYSSYSYLAAALLIVCVMAYISKWRLAYFFLSVTLGCLIFMTQVNNSAIAQLQRSNTERWYLFDAAVSLFNKAPDAIYISQGFFQRNTSESFLRESYWPLYADKKKGIRSKIVISDGESAFLRLLGSSRSGAVLLQGENGRVDNVVTKMPCLKFNRCFLSVKNRNAGNYLLNGADNFVEQIEIKNGRMMDGVHIYPVNIPLADIISFSNFPINKQSSDIRVGFDKGIYSLERRGDIIWRWAKVPAAIKVISGRNVSKTIEILIRPAINMDLSFGVQHAMQYAFLEANKDKILRVHVDLIKNEPLSILFESEKLPIKLNEKDHRVFSFQILSISIEDN